MEPINKSLIANFSGKETSFFFKISPKVVFCTTVPEYGHNSICQKTDLTTFVSQVFILVRLTTKSIKKFHIGQILKVDEEEQEIHSIFMNRKKSHQTENTFHFLELENTSTHGMDDVVLFLPQPVCGTTLRTTKHLRFDCERLQRYNIE